MAESDQEVRERGERHEVPEGGRKPIDSLDVLHVLGVLILLGSLVLVPLGLPGTWIMLTVLLLATAAGELGWGMWAFLAALVLAAELLEFLVLRWLGARYGGSRSAFWGAVAGGFVGVLVGMPVPVVGPILAGFLGTFVGAAGVTLLERRTVREASRVGWGVILARSLSVAIKTGVGVTLLVVGAWALLVPG